MNGDKERIVRDEDPRQGGWGREEKEQENRMVGEQEMMRAHEKREREGQNFLLHQKIRRNLRIQFFGSSSPSIRFWVPHITQHTFAPSQRFSRVLRHHQKKKQQHQDAAPGIQMAFPV